MRRIVWVKFQIEGFHKYPDAPDDVAYLRETHRHMFHYKVELEVSHDNREVEFHQLLNFCRSAFIDGRLNAHYKSCEMLAADLLDMLMASPIFKVMDSEYTPGRKQMRPMQITVSEDDECGATVHNDYWYKTI